MASNRTRRIAKEIADIRADTHSQITAEPVEDDDVTHLRGTFPGPRVHRTKVVLTKSISRYPTTIRFGRLS